MDIIDSRDLIEKLDELQTELTDNFNEDYEKEVEDIR